MVEIRLSSAKRCTKAGGLETKVLGGEDLFIHACALVSEMTPGGSTPYFAYPPGS